MTTIATSAAGRCCGADYDGMLASFRDQFGRTVGNQQHLFVTDAQGLFGRYLDALPPEERQHHTCHACRHFVERFGHVVTLSATGVIVPVMWGPVPGFYGAAHAAVRKHVVGANVVGVFLSSEEHWGTPVTGEWSHMAVKPPKRFVFERTRLKTAGQAAAEKREEYRMLVCGLADFQANVVDQAVTILKAEALYRSEKCLDVAEWLAALHATRAGLVGKKRVNVTWLAVASAPAGYCHVRSTMIGTLLEDLTAGKSFADVKRAFGAKMHPLQYQRPQAPPKAGNIARAEKVVAELQSAGALERRYARLPEVQALWRPSSTRRRATTGVFDHLKANTDRAELPETTITWVKFSQTVLPDAQKIEVRVPAHGNFIALCTATDPNAPPIIQWDEEERRNPVNWYVYHGGSPASQWSLRGNGYADVTAITLLPHMWYDGSRYRHQGAGVVLIVKGCRDTRRTSAALFPEVLRSEYHEIRSTIEAHSRSSTVRYAEQASACGLDLRKGEKWNVNVRVTSAGAVASFLLDRWD